MTDKIFQITPTEEDSPSSSSKYLSQTPMLRPMSTPSLQIGSDRNSCADPTIISIDPITPQKKADDCLEKNNKNFLSKANFCKGRSSNVFSHPSNSPIVNYYAGMGTPNIDNPLEEPKMFFGVNRDSVQSQNSQKFDFSPSTIFNKVSSPNSLSLNSPGGNNMKNFIDKFEKNFIIEDLAPVEDEDEYNNMSESASRRKVSGEGDSNNNSNNNNSNNNNSNNSNNNNSNNNSSNNNIEENQLYMLNFINEEENNEGEGKEVGERVSYFNSNDNKKSFSGTNMPIQTAINKAMMKSPKGKLASNKKTVEKMKITPVKKEENSNDKKEINESIPNKENTNNNNNNNINKEKLQEKIEVNKEMKNINNTVNINNEFHSNHVHNYFFNNNPLVKTINEPNQSFYPKGFMNMQLNKFQTNNPNFDYFPFYNPMPFNMNNNHSLVNQRSSIDSDTKKKQKKIKRLEPSLYTGVPLEKLAHNLYILAKDQGGCRYLQKIIDEDPSKAKNFFYRPLIENILKLVNDPFGNYFIQKIFPLLSPDQLKDIILILSPHIFDIGANPHGTRVLQQLINFLSTQILIESFLSAITPFIIPLLKELNGTHVVQKFASDFPKYSLFVYKIIVENSPNLSTHRHGCCVVQKYLETTSGEMVQMLIEKLISNCLLLIVDQFGNYVIQRILLMNNIEYGNSIAMRITENACYYAKHKYSSNVVEKCIDHCDGRVKQGLLYNLMKPESIGDLILDEHGNYVIQKVLTCVNDDMKKAMLKTIIPLFDKLKKLQFGERIINKLLISYPHLMSLQPQTIPNFFVPQMGFKRNPFNGYPI